MKNVKLLIFLLFFLLLLSGCSTTKPPLTPEKPEILSAGPFPLPFKMVFIVFTTDPDGDDISYRFDWGDGNISEWSNFVPSGDTVTGTHYYTEEKCFEIEVQAQDIEGLLSAWSEATQICINASPPL